MKSGFEKEVCDVTERIGQGYGMDSSFMKLFTTLFLEPEPISLEEIARKTGYGLSTVSGKMKFLVSAQMVKRISKPGSRKAYFLMTKDLREIIPARFNIMLQVHINPIRNEMPEILRRYKKEVESSDDPILKKKYGIIRTYVRQVNKIQGILKETMKKIQEI